MTFYDFSIFRMVVNLGFHVLLKSVDGNGFQPGVLTVQFVFYKQKGLKRTTNPVNPRINVLALFSFFFPVVNMPGKVEWVLSMHSSVYCGCCDLMCSINSSTPCFSSGRYNGCIPCICIQI